MQLCTCHWCHYSTPENSVRGPLSACLKITDPPCQHGLDIFGFDANSRWVSQIRFAPRFGARMNVSFKAWVTIHQSIHHPTTLQTLQSWKNVTRGLRPWRCVWTNRNLCLCHLCPRWCQRSLWTLWCRFHITSYLERLLLLWVGRGLDFPHLTVSGLQLRIFQGHERLIYHCSRGESMWNTISSTGISIKTKVIK